jgi:hypothetical protein
MNPKKDEGERARNAGISLELAFPLVASQQVGYFNGEMKNKPTDQAGERTHCPERAQNEEEASEWSFCDGCGARFDEPCKSDCPLSGDHVQKNWDALSGFTDEAKAQAMLEEALRLEADLNESIRQCNEARTALEAWMQKLVTVQVENSRLRNLVMAHNLR